MSKTVSKSPSPSTSRSHSSSNTLNAPSNLAPHSSQNRQFATPAIPNTNIMEAYNVASQFAANEGARARNESALAAQNAAAIAGQAYREKLATERDFGGGGGSGGRGGRGGGGGGGGGMLLGASSESFGEGAAAPSGYSVNAFGQRGLYNRSAVADWQNRQNQVLSQSVDKERQLSAIRTQEENARTAVNQNRDIDIMNRQASLDAQVRAQEGQRASESGKSQRESNERIAAMSAQSQALGGLFGSIGQRQQSNFWS